MKRLILLQLCLLMLCSVALSDWDEGDGHKMHFPQTPKPGGWDVDTHSDPTAVLADDWLCTETGPVSGVHFWASWKDNLVGTVTSFNI